MGWGLQALSIAHYTLTKPGIIDEESEMREFEQVTSYRIALKYRSPATLKHLCPLPALSVHKLFLARVVLLSMRHWLRVDRFCMSQLEEGGGRTPLASRA